MARYTRIDYMLLALLSRRPGTANALAGRLAGLPFSGRGTSTGAVYPAVRRLEGAGLVVASDKPRDEIEAAYRARNRRGRGWYGPHRRKRIRLYRLSDAGWAEVREWAGSGFDEAEMLTRPDELLLRFLVIAKLDPDVTPDEHAARAAARGEVAGPGPHPPWRVTLEGARPPPASDGDEGRTGDFLRAYAKTASRAARSLRWSLVRARSRPRRNRHPLSWIGYDASWERRVATELMVSLFEWRAAWARNAALGLPGCAGVPDREPADRSGAVQ